MKTVTIWAYITPGKSDCCMDTYRRADLDVSDIGAWITHYTDTATTKLFYPMVVIKRVACLDTEDEQEEKVK